MSCFTPTARYEAALEVFYAWESARVHFRNQLEEKAGLRWAKPADLRAFRASQEFATAMAGFLARHPEVPRPARPIKF